MRLLLIVVLHVTNREREFENPFHHTPLVLGWRWMENRRPLCAAPRTLTLNPNPNPNPSPSPKP